MQTVEYEQISCRIRYSGMEPSQAKPSNTIKYMNNKRLLVFLLHHLYYSVITSKCLWQRKGNYTKEKEWNVESTIIDERWCERFCLLWWWDAFTKTKVKKKKNDGVKFSQENSHESVAFEDWFHFPIGWTEGTKTDASKEFTKDDSEELEGKRNSIEFKSDG